MKTNSSFSGLMILILGMMALLLAGCASPVVKTEVVYETKTVYVTPDQDQLRRVIPPKLISREAYVVLKDYERESYLSDYALDLFAKLGVCNAQLESIEKTAHKVSGGKP